MKTLALLLAALLLSFTAFAGTPGDDSDGENRCDQLGSICLCADSLNSNDTITPAVGSYNPANSTSKECSNPSWDTAGGEPSIVSETGMPAGNSVDYVLAMPQQGDYVRSWNAPDPTGTPLTDATVCERYYFKWSGSFPHSGSSPDQMKIQEFDYSSDAAAHMFAQTTFGFDGNVSTGTVTCEGSTSSFTLSGDTIHYTDCDDGWCRAELCVTIVSGTVSTRFWVHSMETNEDAFGVNTTSCTGVASINWDDGGDVSRVGNLYTESIASAGTRYVSHGLMAQWPTSQPSSTWIGPASEVEGRACTDGINCFCDRIKQTGETPVTNVVLCEDFEAKTLYEQVSGGSNVNAAGEKIYGSPMSQYPLDSSAVYYPDLLCDNVADENSGCSSYWTSKYGHANTNMTVPNGTSHPATGETCNCESVHPPDGCYADEFNGTWDGCSGTNVWDASNRWGTNLGAPYGIWREGDQQVENPSISKITIQDGRQIYASRVGGDGRTFGIHGSKNWTCGGGDCDEISFSAMMAFSSNTFAAGGAYGCNAAVKFEEWGSNLSQPFMSVVGAGGYTGSRFPFRPIFGLGSADSSSWPTPAECAAAVAGATIIIGGTMDYTGDSLCYALRMQAGSNYDFTTDWGLNNWGLVQGWLRHLRQADTHLKLWFNGTLVLDIIVDTTLARGGSSTSMAWNNYANRNQGDCGAGNLTTETVFRAYDNVLIMACDGSEGCATPPSPTIWETPEIVVIPPVPALTHPMLRVASGAVSLPWSDYVEEYQ